MTVTTAVTCPMIRAHPGVIAHAAATSAVLLEGRFNLGVGSGEALNEHVFGGEWPEADERLGSDGQGGVKVCWDEDEQRARRTAHRLWPNEALPGELAQILPTPRHFEQAAELVTEEMVAARRSTGCASRPCTPMTSPTPTAAR